jgi:predicted RNase H-like HicB family nuclease
VSIYYGIVHKDPESAFGIHFPDVPLCFSAADEIEGLLPNAMEALAISHEYKALPPPSTIEQVRNVSKEDIAEGAFILAVPLISIEGRTVRANITMDAGLLASLDAAAKQRKLTRSAYLAQLVRDDVGAKP